MKFHDEIFFLFLSLILNTSAEVIPNYIWNKSRCQLEVLHLNVNDNNLGNAQSFNPPEFIEGDQAKIVPIGALFTIPVVKDPISGRKYILQKQKVDWIDLGTEVWVFDFPPKVCGDQCVPGSCDCCGANECTGCIGGVCAKPVDKGACNNCCECKGAYNNTQPYTCKAETCQIPQDGVVCGDPHFKTWHGEHFSYHGECDLVLVKADDFSNGLGLRIHIRTKIEQSWSYVKFAAIKIGNDVLEVQGQGEVWDKSAAAVHYINGNLNAELPFELSGKYPVIRLQEKHCSTDESNCVEAIIYKIDLFKGSSIKVTQQWGVIRLGVTVGGSNDFDGSVGLMGHLSKPGFWARDSLAQFTEVNINQFGQEWQVQESEPMIFNERHAPQHPEQCRLPTVSTKRRLRKDSVLHQLALDACAGVQEASKEFCIFDVTATGRVEAASTYYTAYVG